MRLVFTPHGWDDYRYWLQADRMAVKRINKLIDDALRDPVSGIGKPEPVRHMFAGAWSRRITDEHRLHDRDLRGRWALVPALLLGTGFALFARLTVTFEDEPDTLLFAAGFVNNLVYFASLGALVWQLARAGSPGDNRFGPPAI